MGSTVKEIVFFCIKINLHSASAFRNMFLQSILGCFRCFSSFFHLRFRRRNSFSKMGRLFVYDVTILLEQTHFL